MNSSTPKLVINGRQTRAFYLLDSAAKQAEGIKAEGVNKRARSDSYNVLERLKQGGLLEIRFSGPRGGARYHITPAGRLALIAGLQSEAA